ncbi:Hypothetical_protein [Hexamita inflata]|uniref:Hypothetical_protein n=1 Tax=Hexamita inflata TaxID=28002 RepID=A0AA86NTQ5_9EUKA|nr:Hypothetical protein HINF_LOCUS12981 [Hexamita inflata]
MDLLKPYINQNAFQSKESLRNIILKEEQKSNVTNLNVKQEVEQNFVDYSQIMSSRARFNTLSQQIRFQQQDIQTVSDMCKKCFDPIQSTYKTFIQKQKQSQMESEYKEMFMCIQEFQNQQNLQNLSIQQVNYITSLIKQSNQLLKQYPNIPLAQTLISYKTQAENALLVDLGFSVNQQADFTKINNNHFIPYPNLSPEQILREVQNSSDYLLHSFNFYIQQLNAIQTVSKVRHQVFTDTKNFTNLYEFLEQFQTYNGSEKVSAYSFEFQQRKVLGDSIDQLIFFERCLDKTQIQLLADGTETISKAIQFSLQSFCELQHIITLHNNEFQTKVKKLQIEQIKNMSTLVQQLFIHDGKPLQLTCLHFKILQIIVIQQEEIQLVPEVEAEIKQLTNNIQNALVFSLANNCHGAINEICKCYAQGDEQTKKLVNNNVLKAFTIIIDKFCYYSGQFIKNNNIVQYIQQQFVQLYKSYLDTVMSLQKLTQQNIITILNDIYIISNQLIPVATAKYCNQLGLTYKIQDFDFSLDLMNCISQFSKQKIFDSQPLQLPKFQQVVQLKDFKQVQTHKQQYILMEFEKQEEKQLFQSLFQLYTPVSHILLQKLESLSLLPLYQKIEELYKQIMDYKLFTDKQIISISELEQLVTNYLNKTIQQNIHYKLERLFQIEIINDFVDQLSIIKLEFSKLVDKDANQAVMNSIHKKLTMKLKQCIAGKELDGVQAYSVCVSVGFLLSVFKTDWTKNLSRFLITDNGKIQQFEIFFINRVQVEQIHNNIKGYFAEVM